MLTHLSVQNFTLVDLLELELRRGMTVITGETGAGKSILLDALALAMGDRAEADRVRAGRQRADISATFDISHIPEALQWLEQHDLNGDDPSECILRRALTREGRSRGYINGHPVPLAQLKSLGDTLIDIHGQHAHQSLLKKDTHRRQLDDFAQHNPLAKKTEAAFLTWQAAQEKYDHWRTNAEEITARVQLLRYQLEELDALNLEPGEIASLEKEQKQLDSAESILQVGQMIHQLCEDDQGGITTLLSQALHKLHQLTDKPDSFLTADELLQSALIQVQEAQHELNLYIDNFEIDPQRLKFIEERLTSCYDIARKHRVKPDELPALQQTLQQELAYLGDNEEQLDVLEAEATAAHDAYLKQAQKLSKSRLQAGQKLESAINSQLKLLAMKHAYLTVALKTDDTRATRYGIDDIEFLVSTNPGQPPKPLGKVASGGELSRISLAIQVVTAQNSTTPTLVFDEVDVGIGGATADVVGELLRRLGEQGQVICVTHLPQVASKGHHHLLVNKESDEVSAQSALNELEGDQKILEVARMMGGSQLTKQTIAHAREMLEMAH